MAEKNFRLKRLWTDVQAFWDETALKSETELSRLHKFIHFWVLVVKSFVRNRCPIRASALSYTTLLALIPMLAVALSVTSSLLKKEGEDRIYKFIDKFVSSVIPPAGTNAFGQSNFVTNAPSTADQTSSMPLAIGSTNMPGSGFSEETGTNQSSPWVTVPSGRIAAPVVSSSEERAAAQKEAARKIHEYIQNTRNGTLGVTGMIVLIFVAIRMLSSIEATFNDIWGITRGRNWFVRIVVYWTTITLGPLLLAAALGLASGPHLEFTQNFVREHLLFKKIFFPAVTLIVLWLAFALFYKAVPNTKVHFGAALVGGVVGGTAWHVNNLFGVLYVSRVVSNSQLYGKLGLVPVFMAGIYISWLLLLFGAQVAYAFQNRALYMQEKIAENVNQRGREFIALRLMTCIGQRFQRGLPSATIPEMSSELAIPSRLVQQVLQTLIAAHLVAEINGAEPAYTPARPLEAINAHHVLQAMRSTHGQELVTRDEPVREEVYGEFARIQEAEKQAASTITMLALVGRAQARLEFAVPQMAGDEIKMKPAFVPTIEPATESAQKKIESVHSSAEHSLDLTPTKFSQGNVRQGNELPGGSEDRRETTTRPEMANPKKEVQAAHSAVQPRTEEERDFPL